MKNMNLAWVCDRRVQESQLKQVQAQISSAASSEKSWWDMTQCGWMAKLQCVKLFAKRSNLSDSVHIDTVSTKKEVKG